MTETLDNNDMVIDLAETTTEIATQKAEGKDATDNTEVSVPSGDAGNRQQADNGEGWKAATHKVWNGAIFTGMVIILCACMLLLLPHGDIVAGASHFGLGALIVYLLLLALTTVGSIVVYPKGLRKMATLFGSDGSRALKWIEWGYYATIVGALLHLLVFYLPLLAPETKRQLAVIAAGNSVLLVASAASVVGFIMLATAKGCPDASRKGCASMIAATLVLLGTLVLLPFANAGSVWMRVAGAILLLVGAFLFLRSWRKIVRPGER